MSTTTQELRKKGFRSVVTFKESKHYLQKMERSVLYKLLEQAWTTDKNMRDSIQKQANEMKMDETWIKASCQEEMLKSNWGVPLAASEDPIEFLRFPTNDICLGKFDGAVNFYRLPTWHDWENETLVFSKTRLDGPIEIKEKYCVTFEQTVSGKKGRLRIEPALERFDTDSEDQEREQFRKEPYFAYPERSRDSRWSLPFETMPEEFRASLGLGEINGVFNLVSDDEDSLSNDEGSFSEGESFLSEGESFPSEVESFLSDDEFEDNFSN